MTDQNTDVIPELRNLLSHHLLGHPYDRSSNVPENALINHLSEAMIGFEVGDYNVNELRAIFRQHQIPGFDLDQWLQRQVDRGVYMIHDPQ